MMSASNSIPSISMQPSQPVAAFQPTPPPAPIMVTMPAPPTTPRRQLSLMERLATRNAVKTTPSPSVTNLTLHLNYPNLINLT